MTGAPLSIAMITIRFHPYVGGAERQALALSRVLVRRGADVTVLTRGGPALPAEDEVDGVRVRRLAPRGGERAGGWLFLLELLAHLASRRYDVHHAHLASSPAVVAALVGRIAGRPTIAKLGGGVGVGEIARSRGTVLGRLKLLSLGGLRPTLVGVNEDQLGELEGFGLESVPRAVIPNGVDLERFRPASPEERRRLRRELGWSGRVFLWVGRVDSDKGQLEALRSFLAGWAAARIRGHEGLFRVAGDGPRLPELQELLRSYGLDGRAGLLGRRDDVAELLQAADVFVLPSLSEGLSNALLEAMACGVPALASAVTGTVEVVRQGVEGFLFDPRSPGDVEARLVELGSARLEELGRAARRRAEDYSIERTADRYLELYRSLASRGRLSRNPGEGRHGGASAPPEASA